MTSALNRAAATVGRRAMRPRGFGTPAVGTSVSSGSPVAPLSSVAGRALPRGRWFSAETVETHAANAGADPLSSPKLQGLYDRVVTLPEEEVNVLGAMVLQLLGRTIFPGEFGTPGGAAAPVDGAAGAAPEEAVEEKTQFDVRLLGFDAKSKIKVIKEIRAIAGLGLKEAKDLVEAAPKVIQKDLKREAADELKEKMEALGAQIEIV